VKDLISAFNEYFEVLLADTPELQREAYRLRYEVYCEEGCFPQFACPSGDPDRLETDDYDHRSVHCVYRHRPSGSYAGTVRLVLVDPDDVGALFPLEEMTRQFFPSKAPQIETVPRNTLGEISRFLLHRRFRSRAGEALTTHGLITEFRPPTEADRRRHLPHAVIGLFVAVVRMSVEYGLTHWYAAMEPSLARLLRSFAIHFEPIGPVVEYYGPRQPFLGQVAEIVAAVRERHRELWELATDDGRMCPATP
jgi:N-acyl amino acid synthase of PEP-CTERM/exosortase system